MKFFLVDEFLRSTLIKESIVESEYFENEMCVAFFLKMCEDCHLHVTLLNWTNTPIINTFYIKVGKKFGYKNKN